MPCPVCDLNAVDASRVETLILGAALGQKAINALGLKETLCADHLPEYGPALLALVRVMPPYIRPATSDPTEVVEGEE